jgi:hypothetical protein
MNYIIFIILALSSVPETSYKEYCRSNLLAAKLGQMLYGVPISIQFAQSIAESGGGRSYIAKSSNNHFGIRYYAKEFSGDCFTDRAGQNWRSYCLVFFGYLDHAAFISKHYPNACWGNYTRFKALSGYGGDKYWRKITKLVQTQKLAIYDWL